MFQSTSKVQQAVLFSKAISVKCLADGNRQIHAQSFEVSKILQSNKKTHSDQRKDRISVTQYRREGQR